MAKSENGHELAEGAMDVVSGVTSLPGLKGQSFLNKSLGKSAGTSLEIMDQIQSTPAVLSPNNIDLNYTLPAMSNMGFNSAIQDNTQVYAP